MIAPRRDLGFHIHTNTSNLNYTRFLSHYVVNIIRCPFLFLIFFVSDFQPLFLSFLVIMKGGMSKEKPKKMLRDQSLTKVEQDCELDITPDKGNQREKYIVSISSKKVIFTKMDKLHRWIVGRDVAWEKQVGISGLLSLEFMPICPLVKEFIQGIVWSNTDVIKSIIQGVPVLFIENTMAKVLLLPQVGHLKLLTKQKEPSLLKITPPKALVDKERQKVSMFKGMYITRMPALIQGIQLKDFPPKPFR